MTNTKNNMPNHIYRLEVRSEDRRRRAMWKDLARQLREEFEAITAPVIAAREVLETYGVEVTEEAIFDAIGEDHGLSRKLVRRALTGDVWRPGRNSFVYIAPAVYTDRGEGDVKRLQRPVWELEPEAWPEDKSNGIWAVYAAPDGLDSFLGYVDEGMFVGVDTPAFEIATNRVATLKARQAARRAKAPKAKAKSKS